MKTMNPLTIDFKGSVSSVEGVDFEVGRIHGVDQVHCTSDMDDSVISSVKLFRVLERGPFNCELM